ncbi:pyridoxamine 5'-phosphate oxidase [Rhodococcus sp. BP-252]|uniref:pyridoxamine 5'-phosphate oxidase n=1 Tax=unclassified Rhodococcus (in: high G+C Gram-positive bacteria) TaxID=192944 RepID=UPI001C9B9D5D|nr:MULTISPECIES: pyridoxamine 5'-phosphate oxidase [unclassified Rhodococcus (in: high G+C Gram-positive bacteria)]MBY6413061.1 pyridoxamine 5'-phosphate oxidase [Rhodococcus sp. BP-320]MBY6417776.1 pyridoxamine 5'-phosphate oxidase [Rhodococcus sp. BP-321]MBY6423926.1 pyridoxamine 5'-phosphate oxidase [Rhodococcus sp. BP-324]MBY6427803.1 pyridoxamine 5'-phosphate oxidase [Rhodococcus sp. BP-323]MBY6431802.1 pyridoxamine 5'-phosphate oxidase [Rhodococcus sp. BP-322]
MRVDYRQDTDLDADQLVDGWFPVARAWLSDAIAAEIPEPNAMVLATVDEAGRPSTRTVLCKDLEQDGVVFYTNYDSDKATHLTRTPYASVTFPWIGIARQLSIRGSVVKVSAETTAEYFATRPRGSQLGAWASAQSRPIGSRAELEQALADVTTRFDGEEVPVPPNWGGFRLIPDTVEFWQGRTSRLHNRIRVTVANAVVERLQP